MPLFICGSKFIERTFSNQWLLLPWALGLSCERFRNRLTLRWSEQRTTVRSAF
jgi:hypothetical protein